VTQAGQPTPEEMQAYVNQLRDADPAGVVAEAYNMLASVAQVKLGRPDARMLIDVLAAVVEAGAERLPAELVGQMRNGVTQLQMAQVQAEREEQEPPQAEAADQEAASSEQPPRPSGQAGQRMTDRLWIPGRGQTPPPPPSAG
jgi:hypothetical protein